MLIMISSYLFTISTNSMLLGIFVIIQALIYSTFVSFNMNSSWYGYILFLIMLGGILIIFMFVISISSNQILYVSFNKLFISMMFIILLLIPTILMNFSKEMTEISSLLLSENENTFLISKIFTYSYMKMTLLVILYLFLSMISIVKIAESKKGSFRSF
uniref:NADH dehydrogenase subunit 6 n=1 Tax=Franklinothrips vespiformis TaxID=297892 RepID=A0A8A5LBI0_FRAVS|nr:NADH dehydrogenase subunit 6 [Franklinothrips vespiformis]